MVAVGRLRGRRRGAAIGEPIEVIRRMPDRVDEPQEPPAPPGAHRFKVVDAVSGRLLADDAEAREAVAALERLRSVVDARIDMWDPASGDWRPLSMGEKKVLWAF